MNGMAAADSPRSRMNSRRVFLCTMFRPFYESRPVRSADIVKISNQQLLNVEAGLRERLLKLAHRIRSIRHNRLFHDVMKQLLNEAPMGLRAGGQELGQLTGSDKLHLLSPRFW